jgi:hypothetical protein
MAILRHARISITMGIYTEVPSRATRDALRRLSRWLDQTRDDADATHDTPEDT